MMVRRRGPQRHSAAARFRTPSGERRQPAAPIHTAPTPARRTVYFRFIVVLIEEAWVELQMFVRTRSRHISCASFGLLVAAVLILAETRPSAAAIAAPPLGAVAATSSGGSNVSMTGLPFFDHSLHRAITRFDRSARRFLWFLGDVGFLWVGILASIAGFFVTAAFASAIDRRMFSTYDNGSSRSRDLGYGVRTFFRVLRDRRTPYMAHSFLLVALLYWLAPTDLIPDTSWAPGLIDDVLVTVIAAKVFIYLCPDWLVARHAAAVNASARH